MMTPQNPTYAAIQEIIAHLGAACTQVIAEDDPIIVGHLRDALTIARSAAAEIRAETAA